MSEPCDTSLNGRNFLSPIVAAYQRLEGWLQKILGGRRAILIGAGMAVVCSIFMACPNWGKVSVLTYYLQKASDPWTALGEPESHEAKLTYRLTGALIAHHLGLAEKGHVVMMACCTVLLLLAVMAAAARITRDNVTAFFITSAVAWTHAGIRRARDRPLPVRSTRLPARGAAVCVAKCDGDFRFVPAGELDG